MSFIKKIFTSIILILSVILFTYVFYQSEIKWKGDLSDDYYQLYYIISLTLIILSFTSFFLSKKMHDYFLITFYSIFFTLYLFELYVTFNPVIGTNSLNKKKLEIYKNMTGKNYDTRTKFEIFNDLSETDNNVVVTIYPFNYLENNNKYFPLSGISNSKTIYCNENGYYSIYESDRFGFNNPDSEWDQKEIEFLLLGDSYTHGACVNRPNDIASVLRSMSKKSVLNLGYAGSGPLIQYASLVEYLKPNTKKVLWIYYEENDLFNLDSELKNDILKKYLDDPTFTQNLKDKQIDIDIAGQNLLNKFIKNKTDFTSKNRSIIYIKFINLIKLKQIRYLLHGSSTPKPYVKTEFVQILKITKKLVSQNNSKLYFVYLPQRNHLESNFSKNSYLQVKKIVSDLDIPFIDIKEEVFEKYEDINELFPFLFKNRVHFNSKGYKKVAETIYNFDQK